MNTPSEKSLEKSKKIIEDAYLTCEEGDVIIAITERGLRESIGIALDTARREAYEECLNIAHYNSWSVQDLDEEKSGYNKACDDLIKEIRERINLNK